MSVVVSSTTDTQEAVNAAAGIGTGTTQEAPSEAPPQQEETETDGDPETPEDDKPDQEDTEESPQHKKPNNVQRRIDRLVREKYQAIGRVQELERRLMESAPRPHQDGPPPAPPQQQPQPQQPGRPQEGQYATYEEYIDALTDFKAAQAFQRIQQDQMHRQAAQQQYAAQSAWQSRVQQYRAQAPDFESVLENAEDIQLSPALQAAIVEHEAGPRLAYELARERKTLERIAQMAPTAAIRELGKFEAKLGDLNGTHTTRSSAVSKAPPPISPVGQGSTRSTKSPDEMSYREYKAWREKGNGRPR